MAINGNGWRPVKSVITSAGKARPPASRTAAGIVVFGPDPEQIQTLLSQVSPQVEFVYVVVNGLIDPALRTTLGRQHPAVTFIDAPVNFGIATALNLIALAAILDGCERLVLFDQDSCPAEDLVSRLSGAWARLAERNESPAAVGPRLIAPATEGVASHKTPCYRRRQGRKEVEGCIPVQFLISSGSLIDLFAFRQIGTFRDDYFIDAVDLEWCFRAWCAGFSCWVCDDVSMTHRVGDGVIGIGSLPFRMPRQRTFRMASYVRNNVHSFRLPHVPPKWKLRQALYLPLQIGLYWAHAGFDPTVIKILVKAMADGVRGRLGPPDGAPFT